MTDTAGVFVAGHTGLLGSALSRGVRAAGHTPVHTIARAALDLRRADHVRQWLESTRPESILMAAGTVGGVHANLARPADFIADNLAMQLAILEGARAVGVRRLILFGCACMYPQDGAQPLSEDTLGRGRPDPSSLPYATAKLSALTLAQAYRTQHGLSIDMLVPANLYGPHDNFSLTDGHVVGALLQRLHHARTRGQRTVLLSGTGRAERDFLFVEDVAPACLTLLADDWQGVPVNLGSGVATSIATLANIIRDEVHPDAEVRFTGEGPDGPLIRTLDISRARDRGWTPRTPLREGIRATYAWVRTELAAGRTPRGWHAPEMS